jgi:hypothetical protein
MTLRHVGSLSFLGAHLHLLLGASAVASVIAACSSSTPSANFGDQPGGSSGSNASGGPSSSGGTFGSDGGGAGNRDGAAAACAPNPANAEIAGNNCDDDGDGKVDNAPICDTGIAVTADATGFANAIGICDTVAKKGHGLVSATYTRGFGKTEAPPEGQHGILAKYGNVLKPREGATLGVISTGWAREFNEASGSSKLFVETQDWFSRGTVPPGFPKPAAGCMSATATNDVVNVKLVLKVPANAKGLSIDFNFFSSEWPEYLCSEFNDAFIVYLTSKANAGGMPDNIAFDAKKNPVSVNNGFFDRCTPNAPTGCEGSAQTISVCPGGPDELGGTGFGVTRAACGKSSTSGGATGWLTSTAPVQPGEEITLELLTWDTGDGSLDSSALLDNFHWIAGETKTETVRPPR